MQIGKFRLSSAKPRSKARGRRRSESAVIWWEKNCEGIGWVGLRLNLWGLWFQVQMLVFCILRHRLYNGIVWWKEVAAKQWLAPSTSCFFYSLFIIQLLLLFVFLLLLSLSLLFSASYARIVFNFTKKTHFLCFYGIFLSTWLLYSTNIKKYFFKELKYMFISWILGS